MEIDALSYSPSFAPRFRKCGINLNNVIKFSCFKLLLIHILLKSISPECKTVPFLALKQALCHVFVLGWA
jgi:hypothetical protein